MRMLNIYFTEQSFNLHYPVDRESMVAAYTGSFSTVPWWMFAHNSGIAVTEKFQEFSEPIALLDVGCGLGYTSLVAKSLGHTVYVTDIYPQAYEYVTLNAQENDIEPPMWVSSVTEIEEHSIDCVTMCDVLYNHTAPQTIEDVIRCIKPGGKLVLAEPTRLIESLMLQKFDVFTRPYSKDVIRLDYTFDDCEVKEDYTTVNIYTFTI